MEYYVFLSLYFYITLKSKFRLTCRKYENSFFIQCIFLRKIRICDNEGYEQNMTNIFFLKECIGAPRGPWGDRIITKIFGLFFSMRIKKINKHIRYESVYVE